jgi:anti-sigma factor ChrR (cupin superfamily)
LSRAFAAIKEKKMKIAKLENMVKGWFIGNFEPSLLKTNDVEVAVKEYRTGDYDARHYHKAATEWTVVVKGRLKMNGIEYDAGDIIVIEPMESTDAEILEDAVLCVVKIPGANNDKYMV